MGLASIMPEYIEIAIGPMEGVKAVLSPLVATLFAAAKKMMAG